MGAVEGYQAAPRGTGGPTAVHDDAARNGAIAMSPPNLSVVVAHFERLTGCSRRRMQEEP